MKLADIKAVDFIGIGGIGMSALARYFHSRGVRVSGYDKTETELTRTLAAEGMQLRYTENVAALPSQIDLVIYTPAIPAKHSELTYYREHGFPLYKRAAVLGLISRGMRCIAVAGTHGKTTTTSLTTYLIRKGGVDASAFLGGISRDFASNFVAGQSEWVIVEADEYDRSFLHLTPELAAITSLDADHLDIYGDRETMLETGFRAFAQKVSPHGKLLVKTGTEKELQRDELLSFGLESGDYRAENLRVEAGYFVFDYVWPQGRKDQFRLPLPGTHNVLNTVVALSLAQLAGADVDQMQAALPHFSGIGRRFEFVVRQDDVVYIDDYAHHPTELSAAIAAARALYPEAQISGIFQPHLYSRTRDFADGFAQALDALDEVYLLDIYPAREEPLPGISSRTIYDKMKNTNRHLVNKSSVLEKIKAKQPGVLLSLGAGDIDQLVQPLKAILQGVESQNR